MILIDTVKDTLTCSPELFVKTYMDLNHVAAIHRGLNSWVNIRKSTFIFGKNWSLQSSPFNKGVPKQGAYLEYANQWELFHDEEPNFGATWFCAYPYDMVEQYPGLTVVSKLVQKDGCVENIMEFYSTMEHEKTVAHAAMAAYLETAKEDLVAVENLQFDTTYNHQTNGTFHPLLQSGVKHWSDWMKENPGL